jgi:hypothetical protein
VSTPSVIRTCIMTDHPTGFNGSIVQSERSTIRHGKDVKGVVDGRERRTCWTRSRVLCQATSMTQFQYLLLGIILFSGLMFLLSIGQSMCYLSSVTLSFCDSCKDLLFPITSSNHRL